MRTKLQLYTVPGQVYYNSTRQLVLKGADGIVFVADSQDFALDANLESMQNLEDNLKRQGIRIREMPMVIQYNKRDLSNALPSAEIDAELNKLHVPAFDSVATTGLGVEETLKGITQLVLAHLVKKYGLEGSEPLDREIQILNVPSAPPPAPGDSLWDDDEPFSPPAPAPAPASAPQPVAAAAASRNAIPLSTVTEGEFELDDALDNAADESIPLVATELVGHGPAPMLQNPFDDVDVFPSATPELEVPSTSIEIPLPAGILDSLPTLGASHPSAAAASTPEPEPAPAPAPERRATDGLVKEVSIPLNLTLDEIRQHRRLRLKITLDVNLI
jgi:hypothetical protein